MREYSSLDHNAWKEQESVAEALARESSRSSYFSRARMVELQALAYIAQIVGVVGTLTAAVIAVRSYINANKRAEE